MKAESRIPRLSLLPERMLFVLVAFFAIIALIAFSNSHALTQPLNDTGITKCGDYAYHGGSGVHNNDEDCSLTVDADGDPVPPGQDGHYGHDVTHNDDSDGHAGFSFTKIDTDGKPLLPSAADWDCVLDNITELMWEVKTDDAGLRGKNHSYTWYNSDSNTNGGSAGMENGGNCADSINCDTEKYLTQVNAEGLCGHSDWRLPGREELLSIVDYSAPNLDPTIDTTWFPNTVSSPYFSASPYAVNTSIVWIQGFNAGASTTGFKGNSERVRIVRSGQTFSVLPINAVGRQVCKTDIPVTTSTDRFTIRLIDGTVVDNRTGLMWKQCAEGLSNADCTTGTASSMNWKAALDHAAEHTFADYNDWRLPNIKELASIAELSCYRPAINPAVFPNTPLSYVWSASPDAIDTGHAWRMDLNVGGPSANNKDSAKQVWLVRDESSGWIQRIGDLKVSVDSDKEFFRPFKANKFSVRVENRGSTFVKDAELTISHDAGFVPSIVYEYWDCHESAGNCSFVSGHIDGSGTREIFKLSLPEYSTTIIKGEGIFARNKDSVKVTATIAGGLPTDPNPANDSFTKEIGTIPSVLPGTQEAKLCVYLDPGIVRCDDEIPPALLIDDNKPSIILTHGLQKEDCTREEQWTSFRKITPAAGHLLVDKGIDANVIQYFWEGACHGSGARSATAYIQSAQNAPHAGKLLAKKLKEALGSSYSQNIQFIGHSMGTIVNAHAARKFLTDVTSVTDAQVTILDHPNRVSKIPGMFNDDERVYGFDKYYFAKTLPFGRNGLNLYVDNYYAKQQTKSDTKFAGAGVGTWIKAPQDIVNRELDAPHEVGDALLPGEGARIWGITTPFDNDHTGVNQWYRWTMRPTEDDNFKGSEVCIGDTWDNHKPFILDHPTLNPCQQGWHNSIIHSSFTADDFNPPPTTTLSDLNLHAGSGTNCTYSTFGDFLVCNESDPLAPVTLPSYLATADATPPTVSYLDATMTVPVNARYITFDYRFTNVGDGDYVYLLVDDKPVWKMSGDAVTQGEWQNSGPVTIAMEPGENTFIVALYGVRTQNAQFEAKNFQFIEVLPTFADVPPAHTAYESVEALADASVVEGCNADGSKFCPDQALTRDTLAMWLMKAKMGESYTPGPATGLFDDVPKTSPFADWIEAFSNEGITEGCDSNLYCPSSPVDKAQLAKLLLMTLNGTGYIPDAATGELFDDIGVFDFNADWIEDAVKKGLLEGCAYKQFCSGAIMTRSAVARVMESAF